MTRSLLSLRDMTRGSGCTPRTVRYYEREGILRAERTSGGHRLFAPAELERLLFVISLREAGWSLEDVIEVLGVRDSAPSDREACERLDALLAGSIDRLERKIAVLEHLRDDLRKSHAILPVCRECTGVHEQVECSTCGRVPALDRLPRSFRVSWRGREIGSTPRFDERAADEAASDDDEATE